MIDKIVKIEKSINAPSEITAEFFIKNLDWKIEEIGTNKKSDLNKNREWLVARTAKNEDARQWNDFVDF
jgi:hypothetical protein